MNDDMIFKKKAGWLLFCKGRGELNGDEEKAGSEG
jgi:hypothetical protein